MAKPTLNQLWAVFTEDGLDAIWNTKEQAEREAKDLRKMGCGRVQVKEVADDDHAEQISRKILGY